MSKMIEKHCWKKNFISNALELGRKWFFTNNGYSEQEILRIERLSSSIFPKFNKVIPKIMHILIYKKIPKNRDFIFGLNRSGQSSLNLDPCMYMSFFVLYSQYPPSKCTVYIGRNSPYGKLENRARDYFMIWQHFRL